MCGVGVGGAGVPQELRPHQTPSFLHSLSLLCRELYSNCCHGVQRAAALTVALETGCLGQVTPPPEPQFPPE